MKHEANLANRAEPKPAQRTHAIPYAYDGQTRYNLDIFLFQVGGTEYPRFTLRLQVSRRASS